MGSIMVSIKCGVKWVSLYKVDIRQAYKILGVSAADSFEHIVSTYRALVKRLHPDIGTPTVTDTSTAIPIGNNIGIYSKAMKVIRVAHKARHRQHTIIGLSDLLTADYISRFRTMQSNVRITTLVTDTVTLKHNTDTIQTLEFSTILSTNKSGYSLVINLSGIGSAHYDTIVLGNNIRTYKVRYGAYWNTVNDSLNGVVVQINVYV